MRSQAATRLRVVPLIVMAGASPPQFSLDQLPAATNIVLLNIGSNLEPLLPPEGNSSVVSIAYEPIVASQIKPHPGLYVVPAAVAAAPGIAMMGVYNTDGVSSSLSRPALKAHWNEAPKPAKVVPVVSMRHVLQSIQPRLLVWFFKTDMQGHDFAAVSSAGALLTRVPYVMTEVNIGGLVTYEGSRNDYCADWLPHMLALGYRPHKLTGHFRATTWASAVRQATRYCKWARRKTARRARADERAEEDAYWVLNGTTVPPPCFPWFDTGPADEPNNAHWCAERVKPRAAQPQGLVARLLGLG